MFFMSASAGAMTINPSIPLNHGIHGKHGKKTEKTNACLEDNVSYFRSFFRVFRVFRGLLFELMQFGKHIGRQPGGANLLAELLHRRETIVRHLLFADLQE